MKFYCIHKNIKSNNLKKLGMQGMRVFSLYQSEQIANRKNDSERNFGVCMTITDYCQLHIQTFSLFNTVRTNPTINPIECDLTNNQ